MTNTPTPAAALAAYRRALDTHKRADWRNACHMLAAVVEAQMGRPPSRPAKVPKPERRPTLAEFLAVRGVRDEGGELSNIQADRWHKARPFQRRLVRPDGLTLENAAGLAFDAGYFPDVAPPEMDGPDNMHPVTPQMLIDALDRELCGRQIGPEEEPDPDYWHALEDFEREAMAHERV